MDIYPLSPEQIRVVEIPSNVPQLIIAPPGTGKTHTVIGRICYLVETEHIRPGELLVLCFTRAAVKEITTRLKTLVADHRLHDDLRFISVRTFDSFATDLLLRIDDERELSTFGYDERIELAVESLNEGDGDASRLVKNYKHYFGDILFEEPPPVVQASLPAISTPMPVVPRPSPGESPPVAHTRPLIVSTPMPATPRSSPVETRTLANLSPSTFPPPAPATPPRGAAPTSPARSAIASGIGGCPRLRRSATSFDASRCWRPMVPVDSSSNARATRSRRGSRSSCASTPRRTIARPRLPLRSVGRASRRRPERPCFQVLHPLDPDAITFGAESATEVIA